MIKLFADDTSLYIAVDNPDSYSYRIKILNYFYIGTRIKQILHSKLRLECSTLNLHMYQRKLPDSPLCNCGEVERTDHFL